MRVLVYQAISLKNIENIFVQITRVDLKELARIRYLKAR